MQFVFFYSAVRFNPISSVADVCNIFVSSCVACKNIQFNGHCLVTVMFGSIPHDPTFLVALTLIILYKYLIHPVSYMLSLCPDLTGSFHYSRPRRGSSHFVAYSSWNCSLSALWDACPDPPWNVTLDLTLSSRLSAGSQPLLAALSPYLSHPFPFTPPIC